MSGYIFGFVLGAFVFSDVHYYIRTLWTYLFAKFCRKRIAMTDPSEVYGLVLPTDADFMFTHMNNARYFREYDFARFDHGTRCGMIEMMFAARGAVAAHTIRYRLPLMMFSSYKIVTQPVWWDEKFVYVEQKTITLADGIIRSVGYSKIATNFNVEKFVIETFPELIKPKMPLDMQKWLDFNDLSSQKMKQHYNHCKIENGESLKNGECHKNGISAKNGEIVKNGKLS